MEKMKELFSAVVEYCKAEPFHTAILGGLVVFLLVVAGIIIALSAKYSKTKKALEQAQTNTQPTPVTPANTYTKETLAKEPIVEEPVVETVEEAPAETTEE